MHSQHFHLFDSLLPFLAQYVPPGGRHILDRLNAARIPNCSEHVFLQANHGPPWTRAHLRTHQAKWDSNMDLEQGTLPKSSRASASAQTCGLSRWAVFSWLLQGRTRALANMRQPLPRVAACERPCAGTPLALLTKECNLNQAATSRCAQGRCLQFIPSVKG